MNLKWLRSKGIRGVKFNVTKGLKLMNIINIYGMRGFEPWKHYFQGANWVISLQGSCHEMHLCLVI